MQWFGQLHGLSFMSVVGIVAVSGVVVNASLMLEDLRGAGRSRWPARRNDSKNRS
jgi:hypothetical protein